MKFIWRKRGGLPGALLRVLPGRHRIRGEPARNGAPKRCYGKSDCSVGAKKAALMGGFYKLTGTVDRIYYVHNTDHSGAIAAVPLKIDGTSGVNIHYQSTWKNELSLLFCVLDWGNGGVCCCYKSF
ncbi:hypothetical protein JHE55_004726 [Salmonella enterica]|uniref:hypothetical protein n=1 Tax=Enterobacter hormaechei TaxID=158836 RepID=UPI001CF68F50|nr:hypothetical protein [Salmonella enterica]EGX9279858.1 hypothetical protein [Salmonella enterica]MCB3349351.1 hypothetical protein [Klebsiella pneumoniae]MCP6564825.1 hypothetical protein [Klebsiella pneumoniae]HBZ8434529.1 hypothetical protein [Klebsiella pneumoniae]